MFAWTFHQEYELMTPPVGPRSSSRGNTPPRSLILTARLYRVRLSCEVLTTPELSMLSTLETTVSGKLIPERGVAPTIRGDNVRDPMLPGCAGPPFKSGLGDVWTGEIGSAKVKLNVVRRMKKRPVEILTAFLVFWPAKAIRTGRVELKFTAESR